jgi:ATP-dependent 26S proteasome regulatory subunit
MPTGEVLDTVVLAGASEGMSGGDILNAVITAASSAVQRDEPEPRVRMTDLLQAITVIRKAKQEIGSTWPPSSSTTVARETLVPTALTPHDVLQRV